MLAESQQEDGEVEYISQDSSYLFECPHCKLPVQVAKQETNCKIFRHARMMDTFLLRFDNGMIKRGFRGAQFLPLERGYNVGTKVTLVPEIETECRTATIVSRTEGRQVNPHAPQDHCDRLKEKGLIWGCGKPFQLIPGNKLLQDGSRMMTHVRKCGYI